MAPGQAHHDGTGSQEWCDTGLGSTQGTCVGPRDFTPLGIKGLK